MSKRKLTSLLAKLSLLSVSAVVAAGLGEIGFRLLTQEEVALHGLWSADEVLGASLTPGFRGSMRTSEFEYRVAINELGMRDGPVGPKAPGTRRILLLGDSFVYGVGVELEDSLAKALERRLAALSATPHEVWNAGVPGSSTYHHYHLLTRLAPAIRPDVVVLVFFIGDDWYGNTPRGDPAEARRTVKGWLSNQSALFRAFDRFVLARLKNSDAYDIHLREPSAEILGRMRTVLDLIARIAGVVEEHGADLLVVLNPRYTQVYDSAWSKAAFVYRLSEDRYAIEQPNRTFRRRLAEGGYRHVDLLDPFRERVPEASLHFPTDGHWNVEGNAFVAAIVAEALLGGSEGAEEAVVVETPAVAVSAARPPPEAAVEP